MIQQAAEKLYRRILTAIGRGRTTVVQDSGNVQLMQVQLGKEEVHDNMRRVVEYGLTSNPPAGTDAVVVFIGGDRNNGIVIATGNQQSRMKGLAPGEVALYDNLGQSVYLTRGGIVVNGAGLPMAINNVPTLTVNAATEVILNTPELLVNGNIVATGDISDRNGTKGTLQHVRDNYDAHTHPDAQGGNTGTPSNTL